MDTFDKNKLMKAFSLISLFFLCATMLAQLPAKPGVAQVPEKYTFSWAYDLSVEVNGQKVDMTYRIQPDSTYFGYAMKMLPGVLSVTDLKRKLTFKTFGRRATLSALEQKPDRKPPIAKYQYTKLRDSTILGYRCIGIKAESERETAILYFTNEAETAYPELYKQLRVHDLVMKFADYGFTSKSLLMLSDVTLKKSEGHAVITCTRFAKEPVVFLKSEYDWKTQ